MKMKFVKGCPQNPSKGRINKRKQKIKLNKLSWRNKAPYHRTTKEAVLQSIAGKLEVKSFTNLYVQRWQIRL